MKIKNIFKTGLRFGIIMGFLFVIQILLDKSKYTSADILKLVVEGIVTVTISGFIYGLLMNAFIKSKLINGVAAINTEPGETILFETPANHFKGLEGVGGKLYLTNRHLIFQSHKFNIQNHRLSINLNDIYQVDKYKTLGLIKNGLAVTTKKDATENFVVNLIDEWIALLQKNIVSVI